MFVSKCVVLAAIINNFQFGSSLNQLPNVEDNDIVKVEEVIRSSINSLFSRLGLSKFSDKPKIKEYASIHKYLVSLTLQDYTTLKEIAKLTRVDKSNFDYITTDFIAIINEILEENDLEGKELVGFRSVDDFIIDKEIDKLFLSMSLENEDEKNEAVLRLMQRYSTEGENGKNSLERRDEKGETLRFWRQASNAESGRRIYNGKRSKIKHFPFMASVQLFKRFQCAGSIIKSDLVITAASCLQLAWNNRFFRENPLFLSVRVGSSFYEVGGEVINVLEIYFYPSYTPKSLHHNIAIMRLERKIKFKSKLVKKIELDKEHSELLNNAESITIVGWGARTVSNIIYNPYEGKIRISDLHPYPLRECQHVYSKQYVTHRNFCAGFMSAGSGACNRDVGGPGIVSGVLVGIISFGAPVCGTPDAPTVFTKVAYYTDWIDEIMEQEVPWRYHRTTLKPSVTPRYSLSYSSPTEWSVAPLLTTKSTYPTVTESAITNTGQLSQLRLGSNKTENLSLSEFLREIMQQDNKKGNSDEFESNVNTTQILSTTKQQKLPLINLLFSTKPPSTTSIVPTTSYRPFSLIPLTSQRQRNTNSYFAVIYAPVTVKGISSRQTFTTKPPTTETTTGPLSLYFQPVMQNELRLKYVTRMVDYPEDDENNSSSIELNFSDTNITETTARTTASKSTKASKTKKTLSTKYKEIKQKDIDNELEDIVLEIVKDTDLLKYLQIEEGKDADFNTSKISTIFKHKKKRNTQNSKKGENILTVLYFSDNETENKRIASESSEQDFNVRTKLDKKINKKKEKSTKSYVMNVSITKEIAVSIQKPQVKKPKNPKKNVHKNVDTERVVQLTKHLSKDDVYEILKQILDKNPDSRPALEAAN